MVWKHTESPLIFGAIKFNAPGPGVLVYKQLHPKNHWTRPLLEGLDPAERRGLDPNQTFTELRVLDSFLDFHSLPTPSPAKTIAAARNRPQHLPLTEPPRHDALRSGGPEANLVEPREPMLGFLAHHLEHCAGPQMAGGQGSGFDVKRNSWWCQGLGAS